MPASSSPRRRSKLGNDVAKELNLCQIEIGTPVCTDLAGVRTSLTRLRAELDESARSIGTRIAATATHPFGSWRDQRIDPGIERYSRLADVYQVVARQQVIAGCHVHVGVDDPDLARRDHEPGAAVVAGDGRALGELAVLAGRRHRLRELSPPDLAALADVGDAAAAGVGRRVRPPRGGAGGDGGDRGRDLHLLVRASFGAVPDGRVPPVRRLPRRRHDGCDRRPGARAGVDVRPRRDRRSTRADRGSGGPGGGHVAGGALRPRRFVDLAGHPPPDRGVGGAAAAAGARRPTGSTSTAIATR